jgi:hypothetical protein
MVKNPRFLCDLARDAHASRRGMDGDISWGRKNQKMQHAQTAHLTQTPQAELNLDRTN